MRVPGGGTVVLRWDEAAGRQVLRYGGYEEPELAAARACVRPGDLVIDVGANVGLFTIPLAYAVGPTGRVIAIEALRDNVDRLIGNVRRNGLENVDVVAKAAGASDGTSAFHLARDAAFGSLEGVEKHAAAGVIRVDTVRLDTLWVKLGRPRVALVKIDVEGAELSVVDGAPELLQMSRPIVISESDAGAKALEARLRELGYTRATPPEFSPLNHMFRQTA